MRKCLLVPLAACAAVFALMPASPTAARQPADQWKSMVEKATAYLKKSQNEDGSWSTQNNRGVTGIVVTGLIRTGTAPEDAPAAKGVKFIESLVNTKQGHIAGNDSRAGLINYTTSINIMALTAANKADKYKAVIGNAVKYLKEYQWDEARGQERQERLLRRGWVRWRQVPPRSLEHRVLPRSTQDRRREEGRPGVQESSDVRQPLPELRQRVQHGRWAEEEQRRQLHLHRGQRRREPPQRRTPRPTWAATAA